jgi:hypothetical protein
MARPIKVLPKKRGRPATGKDPLVALRMPSELIEQIEMWAKYQKTGRSEAIRRLVYTGLAKATEHRAKSFKAKTGRALRNVEQDLDDALGNTFPASDPVEMEEPAMRTGRPRAKRARK